MSGLVTGAQLNESVGYVQTQVNSIQSLVGQLQARFASGGTAIEDALATRQAEINAANDQLQADLRAYVGQVGGNFQAMNNKAIELTAQLEMHQQALRQQQEIIDEVKGLKAQQAAEVAVNKVHIDQIVTQIKLLKAGKLNSGDTTRVSKAAGGAGGKDDPWHTWHGSAGASAGDGGGGNGGGRPRGHE